MSTRTPPVMADLADGTRVLHLNWLCAGTVCVTGDVTAVRFEDVQGETPVSPEGPLFPSELMILEEGP